MRGLLQEITGLSAKGLFLRLHQELLSKSKVKKLISRYYHLHFGLNRLLHGEVGWCHKELSEYWIFQIWTKEFIEAFASYLKTTLSHPDALILDAGAGNGLLALWLKRYGFNVIAVDNKDWKFIQSGKAEKIPDWVVNIDVQSALDKFQPEVVIASWMPGITLNYHEEWTQYFRRCSSVKEYILIGEPPRDGYLPQCGGRLSWESWPNWPRKDLLKLISLSLSYLDFLKEHQEGRKSIVCSFKRVR